MPLPYVDYANMSRVKLDKFRYPVVPPYEPQQGEVLTERPGWFFHSTLFRWLPNGDPAQPFRFPGTPQQVYAQAQFKIAGIL